jgi:HSP20 family protein
MFDRSRWSPFDEVFNFQREVDRVFNQFWNDLPARTSGSTGAFQVNTSQEGWHVDVPLPGIDPDHVQLQVTGNTLQISANPPADGKKGNSRVSRYEQTLTLPQFLDVDKLNASYKHGMLQLTIPLKESVKPRRIEIANTTEDRKQLTTA